MEKKNKVEQQKKISSFARYLQLYGIEFLILFFGTDMEQGVRIYDMMIIVESLYL